MRPQIPKNVMHGTISMARVWWLEFVLLRWLRGRKTLLGLDIKPTNFSDPESSQCGRTNSIWGCQQPRAPQVDDPLCLLWWQGTTLVACCDLQYSWDKVTRKSHHPDSVSYCLQIPGSLQHRPRYKVETGEMNTGKETSCRAAGTGALPRKAVRMLCIGGSGLRRARCWGCSCVGRTGSYLWPAETEED